MSGNRIYRFENEEVSAEESLTPEQVREYWSELVPGLVNAEIFIEEDGSVTFKKVAGTKG